MFLHNNGRPVIADNFFKERVNDMNRSMFYDNNNASQISMVGTSQVNNSVVEGDTRVDESSLFAESTKTKIGNYLSKMMKKTKKQKIEQNHDNEVTKIGK